MAKGCSRSTNARCATRPAARISLASSGTLRSGWRLISVRCGLMIRLYWESGPLKMANSEKFMVPFLPVHLDRRQSATLQRQLYDQLRAVILAGSFAPGARLPATRILAADLGVSRNTVAGAFDQLLAEGYLESRVGSGTYVARELPEDFLRVPGGRPAPYAETGDDLKPSRRGQALAAIPVSLTRGEKPPHPFTPGIPALDRFPRDLWARLSARLVRHAPAATLTYGDSIGYRPLRQAIADLGAARSVRCS